MAQDPNQGHCDRQIKDPAPSGTFQPRVTKTWAKRDLNKQGFNFPTEPDARQGGCGGLSWPLLHGRKVAAQIQTSQPHSQQEEGGRGCSTIPDSSPLALLSSQEGTELRLAELGTGKRLTARELRE